ncbi:hypothetical protein K474DRAFT_1655179 [Panus rudis PR-1116 ss-1]|nr:hypothetical protein K474DRAFT_1655179 [Panus rudis PR-1116 ss-1]
MTEFMHPLKSILQLQISTDEQAVLYLPHILSVLKADDLHPSEHTHKWTTRLSSLMLSKDSAARWAGISLALKTAMLSKNILLDCAQSWVGAALPLLSKSEHVPTWKASIRLLRHVFTAAVDIPEFQRQVSIPNVPKFSQSLISVGEKCEDVALKILVLNTLSHLVPLYPTLHRALHGSLSSFSLKYLNGSVPQPIPPSLLRSACELYCLLHYTGGKVGATTQWRKAVDDSIAFAWGTFISLRTTFRVIPNSGVPIQPTPAKEDPLIGVPLHLDRLRAAVRVLEGLLQTTNARPVSIPVGPLVKLATALLRSSVEDKVDGPVDPIIHSLETSAVPHMQQIGCELLIALINCAKEHLTPHISQLYLYVVLHLEKQHLSPQRLVYIQAAHALVRYTAYPHDPLIHSRLARAVLPPLLQLLLSRSEMQHATDAAAGVGGKSKKGKKRARGYEGDEVFNVSKAVVCPTKKDGEILILTFEILHALLQRGNVSIAVRSVTCRTLLAIYTTFPHIPAAALSPDPFLHQRAFSTVAKVCSEIASGTTSSMGKSLGLVVGTSLQGAGSQDMIHQLELLLHPRAPPLVRSLPHLESLSLFRAEENQDEIATRKGLMVGVIDDLTSRESDPLPTQNIRIETPTRRVPEGSNVPQSMNSDNTPTTTESPLSQLLTRPPGANILAAPGALPTAEQSRMSAPVASLHTADDSPARQESSSGGCPTSLSPPRDSIPSAFMASSSARPSMSLTATAPSASSAGISPTPPLPDPNDEDEDEPMPSIDMGSDSE